MKKTKRNSADNNYYIYIFCKPKSDRTSISFQQNLGSYCGELQPWKKIEENCHSVMKKYGGCQTAWRVFSGWAFFRLLRVWFNWVRVCFTRNLPHRNQQLRNKDSTIFTHYP